MCCSVSSSAYQSRLRSRFSRSAVFSRGKRQQEGRLIIWDDERVKVRCEEGRYDNGRRMRALMGR